MPKDKIKSILFPSIVILLAAISLYQNINLLVLSASRVTDENVFTTKNKKVVVISVVKGGASDRAGMLVGDTIVRINGKSFRNSQEADQILRSSPADSLMLYDIVRQGKELLLKVKAAKQIVRFYQISNLLFLVITIVVSLFLLFKKRSSFPVFAYVLTLIVFVSFSSLSVILRSSGINNVVLILFAFMGSLAPPLSVHAMAYIVRVKELNSAEKLTLKINYAVSFILFFSLFFISPQRNNILFAIMIALYSLSSLISNLCLIFFRDKEDRLNRIFFFLSIYLLPAVTGIFIATINQKFLSLLFLLLLYSFILIQYFLVVKYRYFFLEVIVKKKLAYQIILNSFVIGTIVLSLSALSYISTIDLGGYGFRLTPTSIESGTIAQEGFSERPFFLLSGIAFILLVLWLSRYFKNWLNRNYSREEYNYREALSDFSVTIASETNLEELYSSIVVDLKRFLHVKGVALFLFENKNYELKSIQGFTEGFTKKLGKMHLPKIVYQLYSSIVFPKHEQNDPLLNQFAYALVPLFIKEKQVALFLLGEKESELAFNQADFEFVESIANQCAIAIENKRLSEEARESDRIKQELNLAKEIQLGLMPHESPNIKDLDVTGYYESAKEVGGDYYDFFYTREKHTISKMTFVLGDVSGKGISASLYMSRFQGIMSSLFYSEHYSPKDLLVRTNESVNRDIEKKSFVTCICAEYNFASKTMKFSRAGHLPLIYFQNKERKVTEVESTGIGLGLVQNKQFAATLSEEEIRAESGDIFLLYSDGITEAMNEKEEEYGFERLKDFLIQHHGKTTKELSKALSQDIHEFSDLSLPQDDITFITVKIP